MTLKTLMSVAEDGPWCGTRPPGPHRPVPPRPALATDVATMTHFANPRFDGWEMGQVEVGLYGAIKLGQVARDLPGDLGAAAGAAAQTLFNDTCGTIPISVLIWILLHRPPPPPPQWLQSVVSATEVLTLAQAAGQTALANAASQRVKAGLQAIAGAGQLRAA